MHVDACLCAELVPQEVGTRLVLVMHHRETEKTTATGPLALAALPNSEVRVHGLRETPLDLTALHDEGRRVLLLFPREGARPLDEVMRDEDPRAVTLIVPDGNWRQATRASRRIPGMERAEAVTLPAGGSTRWGVRRETRAAGLATFEAIARAMGILESEEVQSKLEALFDRMVATTQAAGGRAEPMRDEEALRILYADEDLVAIHKPAGLLVHRGWGNDERPALQRVRDQIGRFVYPVHRLDRATSGVLLFALSSEVASDMQALFRAREVDKTYLALCRGHDATLTRVDHPLALAHRARDTRAKDGDTDKRPAVTDFRLLGQFERYGLFEAKPRTGRAHQIRRHLKHAAHPIIGDVRYGKGEHNRIFRERFDFHRLALHGSCLGFRHPRSGVAMEIRAPLDDDFAALLERLGLPVDPIMLVPS